MLYFIEIYIVMCGTRFGDFNQP